ncbi:hypothetical protein M8J76_007158 [Diaphorina citri]|nr:hypothetical protein M8J76_007158 [Diaphorina citri]
MDGRNCDWPYYEALLFLKDQFEPRPSSGNLNLEEDSDFDFTSPAPSPHNISHVRTQSPEVTLVDNSTFETLLESLDSDSHGESSQSAERRPRKKKLGDTQQQFLALEQEKIQLMRDRSLRKNEKGDPDSDFFKSILPQIKGLTDRKKLKFRIKILELLDEMMNDDDDE